MLFAYLVQRFQKYYTRREIEVGKIKSTARNLILDGVAEIMTRRKKSKRSQEKKSSKMISKAERIEVLRAIGKGNIQTLKNNSRKRIHQVVDSPKINKAQIRLACQGKSSKRTEKSFYEFRLAVRFKVKFFSLKSSKKYFISREVRLSKTK